MARSDKATVVEISSHVMVVESVLVVDSAIWGFFSVPGYAGRSSVIVVYMVQGESITIIVRDIKKDPKTAEKLFGPTGLKRMYPLLSPQGWDGSETLGESPHGMKMTKGDAVSTAQLLDKVIKSRL